jgi:hypothetical protein
MSVSSDAPARPDSGLTEVERHILANLQQIRFGTLEIVIHDSRVVQIEKSEKVRFDIKGKPLQDSLS